MTFAERLSETCESKGWNRETLASRAGLSAGLVGLYCRGKCDPGVSNLVKLSEALGVSLDYLTDRKRKTIKCKGQRIEGLKAVREARGLTQKQLGIISGIDNNLISRYELGKLKPTLFSLVCLADALDASLDQLVGRTYKKEENHELLNH